MVKQYVLKTLLQTIPTYLMALLAVYWRKVGQSTDWLVSPLDKSRRIMPVFDLVNCGQRHRFMLWNGNIVHNCLGLGYGMGAKKLVKQAYDAGEIVSLADAKAFFKVYWEIFSGMHVLGKRLEAQYKRQGYLVNDFGYRLIPREGYKCLNYFIQSSVSGIIAVLFQKFKYLCPWAKFVTVIHDELIYSLPIDRVDEAKALMYRAMASVNDDLKWTVKIRNGWSVGDSLFTAK